MLKTYKVRYEFGRLIFPEHEQALMPDTANVIITILDDDTADTHVPASNQHDEKLSEAAQRAVAHSFLIAMQDLRKEGFSEDGEKAIASLQNGEYKPTFEARIQT